MGMAADAIQRVRVPIVLPRFLRRAARAIEKRNWRLPHHTGIKGLILLFVGTAAAGTVVGGHGMTLVSAITAWSGLAIEEVRITGQSEASEVEILDRLAIGPFPSLLTLDVEAAKARVEELPWVEQATLIKLYPGTLEVAITEREPYAIWQHGRVASLIDESGRVLADDVGERYMTLPFVAGRGAAERAKEFTDLVDAFPTIAPMVRAGLLVSERRWTLVLDNGIEILLPQDEPAAALAEVVRADADDALLAREVAAIDLRFHDRMIVRLTEAGVTARLTMLKERAEAAKAARTNT
jgi:cell division protein FtsQ